MTAKPTAAEAPITYSERGYTWPMSPRKRERIMNTTPPDMRAVFYECEMRANKALGNDNALYRTTG